MPARLIETTGRAALGYADGGVSSSVTLLIHGVLQAMLLKKVSVILIALAGGLAMVTGAGVWARQIAARPAEDRAGGQRGDRKPAVDRELSSAAGSAATGLEEPTKKDDEWLDQAELLSLDIEQLEGEVEFRKQTIDFAVQSLIKLRVSGRLPSTNELLAPDAKESEIASLEKSLTEYREEWLAKKKELRHKQDALYQLQRDQAQERNKRTHTLKARGETGTEAKGVSKSKPVSPPGPPGLPPILEKRLAEIEGKLDKVLKALEELKHE